MEQDHRIVFNQSWRVKCSILQLPSRKSKEREERRLLMTWLYLPRFRTAALWCWSKESFSIYVLTTQRSIVEHEMTHREPLAKPRQGAMQGRLTLGALNIPPDLWRIYAWKTDHRYHSQRLYSFNYNQAIWRLIGALHVHATKKQL